MVRVLANGVFDLFHYGHLMHLQQASTFGDYLIVSVTKDKFVGKGPGRPVYTETHRAAIVAALKCVDEVIIVSGLGEALLKVKPQIVVKGADYKKLDSAHAEYCQLYGIEVKFTETPKLSATGFLNESLRRSRV